MPRNEPLGRDPSGWEIVRNHLHVFATFKGSQIAYGQFNTTHSSETSCFEIWVPQSWAPPSLKNCSFHSHSSHSRAHRCLVVQEAEAMLRQALQELILEARWKHRPMDPAGRVRGDMFWFEARPYIQTLHFLVAPIHAHSWCKAKSHKIACGQETWCGSFSTNTKVYLSLQGLISAVERFTSLAPRV